MSPVAIIAVIVAIVGIIAIFAITNGKKKAKAPVRKKEEENEEGGKQGDPELYALGMNPISSKPIMYALTTCQHCKNTRKFLDSNNVDYTIIFIDDYSGKQRSELMDKMRTYNPRGTFPTILVPGGKVIIGYRKQLLQEALFNDARTTA